MKSIGHTKGNPKHYKSDTLHNNFRISRDVIQYLASYTAAWLICVLLILGIFKLNNRSFLWLNDGMYQHFISFDYLCDYLKSVILEHKLLPFYNYTIGQGGDILTTLNSYDFTDPVSVVAALFFPLSRVGRYTLMIFIKLYLVGLSFSLYCYAIDYKKLHAVLAGAITYTFSGVILFTFARHPNFINWAYFFPFLLAGIELYLRKGKRIPLVLFVFLSVITSYYTFYMNAVLAVIYVFVHSLCIFLQDKKRVVLYGEIKKWFRIAGLFCIGILLSMCILLPTIYAYLINARTMEATGYTDSALYYPLTYYAKLMDSLFAAYTTPGYYTLLGFNATIIIPLSLLFSQSKKHLELKSLICISAVMLCIPIIGRIMNGFGYASNRWSYALSFYASAAFVAVFSQIQTMTSKEKSCVFMITATFILCCFLHVKTNSDVQKYASLLMIIWVVLIIGIALHYSFRHFDRLIIGLVVAGSCFQIYFTFSPSAGNYVGTFCAIDQISSKLENFSSTAASNLSSDFYRVDKYEESGNIDGYINVNGSSLWWSLIPSYVSQFYTDIELDMMNQNCHIRGLDGRTALLELASVKYYTRPSSKSGLIPYGYKEINSSNKKYQVFENEYALPIGYTYSGYITLEEYNNMNGLEKEQAMLQGVVLEEPLEGYEHTDVHLSNKILDYTITKTTSVALGDHSIKVTDKNGSIELTTVVPEEYEIYVYLKGIELLGNTSSVYITTSRKIDDYSVSKSSRITNLNYNWPVIRDSVAYNLGYGHAGENTITLKFGAKANFSIDEIQIIAVPMSSYASFALDLKKHVLENINIGNDKVSGTVSIPEARILQFAIPYSTGWKAYVDGEERTLLKSNMMYMALPLSAGDHTIELNYTTPYLKHGIFITIITFIVWGLYEFSSKKNKTQQKNIISI